MNFLDHTMTWTKGEAFEMSLLAVTGVLVLCIAGLLWRCSPTPVGQALPIPLTVVALIFLVAGVAGLLGTPSKVAMYTSAFEQASAEFVKAEKSRVEAFDTIYTYTLIGTILAFNVAVCLFALSETPTLRAIAVALVFIGLSALVIDMFSKERAVNYEQAINAEIKRLNATERNLL